MAQYELNLRDYLRIIRKRRLIIILTFIFVTLAGVVFSTSGEKTYQAVTTVKIEEGKTIAGLLTEWIVYSPADTMESQTKLILGYPIMRETAIRLDLIGPDASERESNLAARKLQAKLKTERLGNTNIISISAVSDNPQEAVDLVNMTAQVYTGYNLEQKTEQARTARNFIQEQLRSLEERLREKEEELRFFAAETRNVHLSEPLQQRLAELQFRLTELLQRYTEKHPQILQLQEEIKDIESQIKGFSGEDLRYNRLSREVDADKKLYSMLKEKLEEARINEAQKISDVSVVDPAVEAAEVGAPDKLFGVLVGGLLGGVLGLAFALIAENLDTSIATIEEMEGLLHVPVLGVVSSVNFAGREKTVDSVLFDWKRKIFRRPKDDAEERLVRMLVHFNPESPVAETFRNIHTGLKLDQEKKTILVTSAGPREGKSSVITNLGLAMAQAGLKTLIISTDIRRPVIARTFGIKREPGLTEVLMGMTEFDNAVRNVTDLMLGEISFDEIRQTPGLDNLWILTSGQLPFNPAKIIEAKELTELIKKIRGQFSVIIFDSPPVLPVTDATLLAPRMDCVIMVYEIGRTSREALVRAKNQLEAAGAKIAGIVLNQTSQEVITDAIHPYYYKYRYYQTEKTETAAPSAV